MSLKVDIRGCHQCGASGSDYLTSVILHDGEKYRLTMCYSCAEDVEYNYLYCPECRDIYECEPSWREGEFDTYPTLATVPCPSHSTHPSKPKGKCEGCDTTVVGTNFRYTNRGVLLCHACRTYEARPCSASYCMSSITPTMDGVVSSPHGERLYCPDCSLVRTVPGGQFPIAHPLSWAYSPSCLCKMCRILRGKSESWPTGDDIPPDTMVECTKCKDSVGSTHGTLMGDNFHCHSCLTNLTICSVCEQYRLPDQFHRTGYPTHHSHRKACDLCMELTDKWFCDVQCGSWMSGPNGHCPCGGVHAWNYEPDELKFLVGRGQDSEGIRNKWDEKSSGKIPFFGLEIEIEAHKGGATRMLGAQKVRELMGQFGWVMHDGSLKGEKANGTGGEYGFEFVTHPFTFQWLHENWWRFEELFKWLSINGYRSWEGGRCGIHIHVSRKPMTEAHQMKFIRFIYGYTNLMMCIGQRGYTDRNLAKFSSFDVEDRNKLLSKVRNYHNPGANGHYTAVNTMKRATIEGRWFRGTLNPLAVRKNIELMDAMWWFTKKFGFNSANEINFVGWLRGPREQSKYSTLLSYIEHNYITRR